MDHGALGEDKEICAMFPLVLMGVYKAAARQTGGRRQSKRAAEFDSILSDVQPQCALRMRVATEVFGFEAFYINTCERAGSVFDTTNYL